MNKIPIQFIKSTVAGTCWFPACSADRHPTFENKFYTDEKEF